MPQAPMDPLEWSVEQVKAADFLTSAAYAGSLCRELESGAVGEAYSERLSAMLGHSDGARGFFVTYLTDPSLSRIADDPAGPAPVVAAALRAADASTVAPLAIMNLVMPVATAEFHREMGDNEAAARSALTAQRGARVLQLLASGSASGPQTREQLAAAARAAVAEAGAGFPVEAELEGRKWTAFFGRWKYTPAQMAKVRAALDGALAVTPAGSAAR